MKFKKLLLLFLLTFFLFIPKTNASVLSHDGSDYNTMFDSTVGFATYTYNLSQQYGYVFGGSGDGFVNFSFSISQSPQSSTNGITIVNAVRVGSTNALYACNIGTVHVDNSTNHTETYSVSCPVNFSNSYLSTVSFTLWQNGTSPNYYGSIYFNALITYSSVPYFDVSSINNTIVNSQNNTTNAVNNNTNAVNNNTNAVNDVKNSVNQTNNNIMNDDVSSSSSTASGFFDDFTQNSHGLSGIVTSPLRLLNALSTAECEPLEFTLPFVHNEVNLQCMRPIYENYFGVFFTLFQLITTGMISYHVLINFYKKVRDLQNPNNDRIEVLNL